MQNAILIVGSDNAYCEEIKNAISEKLRYNAFTSSDADEAINLVLATDSSAGLMLLDICAPRIDFIKIIRSIKLYRTDFPVIILTEYGDHAHATEAIHFGANDFLTKPIAIERLGLSIASALRILNLCRTIEKLEQQLMLDRAGFVQSSNNFTVKDVSPIGRDGKVKKLRALEEDAIRFALNVCGGSMSKAARSLGIGRSTLYRKVSELERHNRILDYNNRDSQTTRPIMVRSSSEHSKVG